MPRSVRAIINAQLLAQGSGLPTGPGAGFPGGGGAPGSEPPGGQGGTSADEEGAGEGEEAAGGESASLEDPVRALININTAPAEVLATLPDMTEELATAIVNRRQSQPFAGRGDIVYLEKVDPQVLGNLLEYITVNSDAYRVYALGIIDETEIAVHVTAVIDTSESPALIRYFRQDN